MIRAWAILGRDNHGTALVNEAGLAVNHLRAFWLRDALLRDRHENRRNRKRRSRGPKPRRCGAGSWLRRHRMCCGCMRPAVRQHCIGLRC